MYLKDKVFDLYKGYNAATLYLERKNEKDNLCLPFLLIFLSLFSVFVMFLFLR